MKLSALFLLLFTVATLCSAAEDLSKSAPVKKFRLPTFNQEGYRTSFLEGDEAIIVSSQQIDVKEMHYSLFSGEENNVLETTLLAPVATVRVLERNHIKVEGTGSVRLIRDEVDATGDNWTYDHANKRLLIRKNVHVIYRAVLKDFLK